MLYWTRHRCCELQLGGAGRSRGWKARRRRRRRCRHLHREGSVGASCAREVRGQELRRKRRWRAARSVPRDVQSARRAAPAAQQRGRCRPGGPRGGASGPRRSLRKRQGGSSGGGGGGRAMRAEELGRPREGQGGQGGGRERSRPAARSRGAPRAGGLRAPASAPYLGVPGARAEGDHLLQSPCSRGARHPGARPVPNTSPGEAGQSCRCVGCVGTAATRSGRAAAGEAGARRLSG